MCAMTEMLVAQKRGSCWAPGTVLAKSWASLPSTVETLMPTFSKTRPFIAHDAAAGFATVFVEPLGRCTDELAGRPLRQLALMLAFDLLERGAQPVAQRFEAFAGAALAIRVDLPCRHGGNVPV